MKRATVSDSPSVKDSSTRALWTDVAIIAAQHHQSTWKSPAIRSLLSEAQASWSKLLFPTPKIESWKYTNTEPIAVGSFERKVPSTTKLSVDDLAPYLIPDTAGGSGAARLVWVDGVFSEQLSSADLPPGIEFFTTPQMTGGENEELATLVGSTGVHRSAEFAALATTLMSEIVCLRAKAGVVIQNPLQLLYVTTAESTGSVQVPRVLVVVGENAHLSVVESFVGVGAERYLSIPIVEAFVAQCGRFDHVKIQVEHESACHMSHTIVQQNRSSSASAHLFSFGGALVRNNVDVELLGSGCHSVLNGLSLLVGDQHVDNATNIHHVEPSSESRELFKGVYSDRSRGVFSGTIVVESEAQKTNAFQSNQSLLLSPNASIETRPQLKIWADDVKCTHGATIGQLDSEALFYLRSRGIDKESARHFLVRAFVSEVLTTVTCEGTRHRVAELISSKLEAVAQGL